MEKHIIFYILFFLTIVTVVFSQNNDTVNNSAVKRDSLKDEGTEQKTCMDCHAAIFEKAVKHETKTGKGCHDCHNATGKEHPKTGIRGFELNRGTSDLCLSCHTKMKNKMAGSPNIHQALNEKKSCINCHAPHSSDEKSLLAGNKRELCFTCHNKTIKTPSGRIANIEEEYKKGETKHPPFKKCSSTCHNPHASDNHHLLNIAFPEEEYAPATVDSFALCFECHDMDLIEAPSTTSTLFRNGEKNLHYVHINGEKGRRCTICHSPHATLKEYLIREKFQFGNWEFKINYSSSGNGGSCAPGCHTEKSYSRE